MEDLPKWCYAVCLFTSLASILISGASITLQLTNYRKPFEQRLIVRILVVVPMFAITCYCTMVDYRIGRIIEPVREIYEAFVIYTFYKLLVLMLGGERYIIQKTVDKRPTAHPFPTNLILGKIHISDPSQFLTIKRCILQYVWVKPLIYIMIFITSLLGYYDVNKITIYSPVFWLGVFYNISVTLSLYYLAMFWKCLYDELRLFNPWRKFLCVKLIIFASYWQGLLIGLLNFLGVFTETKRAMVNILEQEGNVGIKIQNGLLCFEMIFFAWMHWQSFPYTDFTSDKIVDSARVNVWVALKDCISIGDLIHDIKMTTLYGDSYNLKNFDSKADSNVYAGSETFNKKIYQGLRMSSDGKKYWINDEEVGNLKNSNDSDKQSKRNLSHTSDGRRRQSFTGSISSRQFLADNKTPLLNSANTRTSYTGHEYRFHNDLGDLVEAYASNNKKNISDSAISDQQSLKTNAENLENELIIDDEDFNKDERLYRYVRIHSLTKKEINYPVEYEYKLAEHSSRIERLRKTVHGNPVPKAAMETDYVLDNALSA